MIILLSPAKTLDFNRKIQSNTHSEPYFLSDANLLAKTMRQYNISDLLQVMTMSEKLGQLTYERYQEWESSETELRQAGAAFKGEAYNGLNLVSLDEKALDFAQKHLRILSGLYGILKPYDLIKPYRLEMGSKLKESSLYFFWRNKITKKINTDLKNNGGPLINLASQEYFKAIKSSEIISDTITPTFKEIRDGKLKTITVYTKKARGMMARYIIENQIKNQEEIKQFNIDGYHFNAELSTAHEWLFTRTQK